MATITISAYINKPGVETPVLFNRDTAVDVDQSAFEALYKAYADVIGDADIQRDGSAFEFMSKEGMKVVVELED
jgi:hypothetical protein